MADLNKVMLIGRLTRDPQVRFLSNQNPVCDFGFAVGRKYKTATGEQKEETAFVDCTIFGKGGEIFAQYMSKGKQCYLEGRLKFDQWDDKTTGQKRSKLNVVVEDFQFLGSKSDGAGGGNSGGGEEGGGYSARDNAGGGNASGGRPGGYGSAPARRPAPSGGASAGGPPAGRAPAAQQPAPEPPYGDEQQFGDDDIPF